MYIGVFAYGEQRFELTFNPCNANILSLCPLNASVPIEAQGIIPVAQSDVANIPSIAFTIPDFEGQAILRIFANSTESQIGCYSAVVTNGSSFSHPSAVGTILGLFVLLAFVASVAAAIYGETVPEMRKHYAHSISVFVVFAVLQHIFFTGALSMNWPSVLVAFWSNYAWAGGMIYVDTMQNSINNFIGSNKGNISMVGAAPSGVNQPSLGGGYQISQIYKRSLPLLFDYFKDAASPLTARSTEHKIYSRDLANSSSGFSWYGSPVKPGLPLPGNYSGFAGTLAEENIPASNAFLTGLLWLLILVGIVGFSMIALKWIVEGLARVRIIRTQRLSYFRAHWLAFTAAAVARVCFIAFFMIVFLTTFQFTLGGAVGVKAIAGLILALFIFFMLGAAAYGLYFRLRMGKYASEKDRVNVEKKKFGFLPWYGFTRESNFHNADEAKTFTGSLPWWRFRNQDAEVAPPHDDEEYTRKFGWLASRFRQSKWWFFSFWLVYELVRACFYGGAAGHALTQVFGLLVVEAIALFTIVILKPFESNRLNVLMVYMLGFSKVATVALSSAFDERFQLNRITTTVIGIVIIVIQGFLTIAMMILIVLGAISSYMSLTRNRESFKPKKWMGIRSRYFTHVDQMATDRPPVRPVTPAPVAEPEVPNEPYFKVAAVRREPKIEDEDEDNDLVDLEFTGSRTSLPPATANNEPYSRTQSLRSRHSMSNLPYGARRHRASWSSRDFSQVYDELQTSGHQSRMSIESARDAPAGDRPPTSTQPLGGDGTAPPSDSERQDIKVDCRRKRRSTNNASMGKRKSSFVPEEDSGILPA